MTNRTLKIGYHTAITGPEATIAALAGILAQCSEVDSSTLYERTGEVDANGEPKTNNRTIATLKPLAFNIEQAADETLDKAGYIDEKARVESENRTVAHALRRRFPFSFGKTEPMDKFFTTQDEAQKALNSYWGTKTGLRVFNNDEPVGEPHGG